MNPKPKHDIGVSYCRKDTEPVLRIVGFLREECGYDVWMDLNLKPGELWLQSVESNLLGSSVVLLFFSRNYFKSRWTKQELDLALRNRHKLKLVPVLLDGCRLPELLGGMQYLSFQELGTTFSEALQRAIEDCLPLSRGSGYLRWVRDRTERLWLYGPLPTGANVQPKLLDVFVPLQARQIRLEEEEDRVQKMLNELGKGPVFNKTRKVELQVCRPVTDFLQEHAQALILGDAGTGKTTLLQWLCLVHASRLLGSPPGDASVLSEAPRFPVYVHLNRFAEARGSHPLGRGHKQLLDYFCNDLRQYALENQFPALKRAFQEGRCLLLFNGLDEIGQNKHRTEVIDAIVECAHDFPNNRYVVSSRPLPAPLLDRFGPGFSRATLVPLLDREIDALLGRWATVLHRPELPHNVQEQLPRIQNFASLARNPLILSLIISRYATRERVEATWVDLLERCTDAFLEPAEEGIEHAARHKVRGCLEYVAEQNHRHGVSGLSYQDLKNYVIRYFEKIEPLTKGCGIQAANVLLDHLTEQPGLLRQPYRDRYTFVHQAFQEYLTASRLVASGNVLIRLQPHLKRDFWWGVVVFAAQILSRLPRGASAASKFIAGIASLPGGNTSAHDLQLAAECLISSNLIGTRLAADLVTALRAMLENRERTNDERIRCGIALGQIGDPRILAREPEMVAVPAGPFWMGSEPASIEPILRMAAETRFVGLKGKVEFTANAWEIIRKLYERETCRHQVDVDDFCLSKFPITNAQYQRFVEATQHREPFREADWAEPYNWRNGTFPAGMGNHPVVLVSYADACAYCRWLSAETGHHFRLPTEAEWEKAARGEDGLVYPWGNDWKPDFCNTLAAGRRQTVPIGVFPQGASPYGLRDMIGNVWEWCSTIWGRSWDQPEFRYPYRANDGREDELRIDGVERVVRGGSWSTDDSRARCAYATIDVPGTRNLLSVGFRVAMDSRRP